LYFEGGPVAALGDLFRRYNLWRIEALELLAKHGIPNYLFIEGDGVPKLKGGLAYGDPESRQFRELLKNIHNETKKKLGYLRKIKGMMDEKINEIPSSYDKNLLNSIHLVAVSLEPKSVIFLVLDERFEIPIRCAVNNNNGSPAYIKKLYNIAYPLDVPDKKVGYNKSLADNINNGLFRKRQVAKYMRTNRFKKPTLVKKSEDGESLVLKNDIPVQTALIKNLVPLQYQSLYIDKTK